MRRVPSIGDRVLVEATVSWLNAGEWAYPPRDGVSAPVEGPLLPIPCVRVRDGISFGVSVEKLIPVEPEKEGAGE